MTSAGYSRVYKPGQWALKTFIGDSRRAWPGTHEEFDVFGAVMNF